MLTLPDYFVRKVSGFPAGIKMPKMVKFETGTGNGFKVIGLPGMRPMMPLGDGDPLNGGDYRYWCGANGTYWRKGYANCRCCNELCFFKKDRKEHKNAGCGALLEEAFKQFKRSNDCIICNLETHRKVYGLPLCCKDCEFEWEYTTATPSALRMVLRQLKEDLEKKGKK